MKTIGIIGQGFVGSAVRAVFRRRNVVLTYDIKDGPYVHQFNPDFSCKSLTSQNPIHYLVKNTDGPIFLCLPTPMLPDGSCSVDIVDSVLCDINVEARSVGIIQDVAIKSTVPPGTTAAMQSKYTNLSLCFNPEFLTERNALADFEHQDRVVLGGAGNVLHELLKLYADSFPGIRCHMMTTTEAELVKYTTNAVLAVHVSLANELQQIARCVGADYTIVVDEASADKRLGTHWHVPGPDGRPGFGGSCLPKDLSALISVAKSLGVLPTILQAAWQKNLEVRPERDWEQLKGRAVVE